MIPKEKLEKVVLGLLEKTKAGKIPWEEVRDGYAVNLPGSQIGSQIKLSFRSPIAEPDSVYIEFLRKDGRQVGVFEISEEDELWPTAKQLYDEIYRIITRWDEVLDEVESYLAKN